MRRAKTLVMCAAVLGLQLGGTAPASAETKQETTWIVMGCGWYDMTKWVETGQAVHGGGTFTGTDFYFDAGTHSWRVLGTEVDTFEGFLNSVSDVNTHRGQFTVTSDIIGDFDGTFVYPQQQLSTDRGHGVATSPDRNAQLRVTMGVDSSPYQPLPCGDSETLVSQFVVTHWVA